MSGHAPLPDQDRVRSFGDVLKTCVRTMRLGDRSRSRFRKLNRRWTELVGETIAARTRIRAYDKGELLVEVDSPVLLHELSGFMKRELVRGLQESPGSRDIVKIRFRLGALGDAPDRQAPQ